MMNYSLLNASSLEDNNLIYSSANNSGNTNNDNNNIISKKRNKTQRRYENNNENDNYYIPQKQAFTNPPQQASSSKVNNVLKEIYKSSLMTDEDDDDNYGNYMPLPPPQSAGVENTIIRDRNISNTEGMNNMYMSSSQELMGGNYPSSVSQTIPTPSISNEYKQVLNPLPQNFYQLPSSSQQQSSKMQYPTTNNKYNVEGITDYNNIMLNASNYENQHIPQYNNSSGSMEHNFNSGDPVLNKLNYMIHLLESSKDEKTEHITEEVILYSFLGVFMIFIVDSFTKIGKYKR